MNKEVEINKDIHIETINKYIYNNIVIGFVVIINSFSHYFSFVHFPLYNQLSSCSMFSNVFTKNTQKNTQKNMSELEKADQINCNYKLEKFKLENSIYTKLDINFNQISLKENENDEWGWFIFID